MNYPEDSTHGDVDQITFRKACDAAAEGKSRISILQILKHAGVAAESAETYADEFLKFGSREQGRSRRPKLIIGWALVALGLFLTVALLKSGWIAGITIAMICAGVYCIVSR